MNKLGAAVVTATLALGLAACSTTAPGPAATDGTGASSASPTTAPAETPSPAASAPAPGPGTPEAAVWEALMGPHGEYHAAASHAAVIEEFGPVQPYSAIKATEERHINSLSRQLDRFGVDVPANPYLGEIDAPPDLETAALNTLAISGTYSSRHTSGHTVRNAWSRASPCAAPTTSWENGRRVPSC